MPDVKGAVRATRTSYVTFVVVLHSRSASQTDVWLYVNMEGLNLPWCTPSCHCKNTQTCLFYLVYATTQCEMLMQTLGTDWIWSSMWSYIFSGQTFERQVKMSYLIKRFYLILQEEIILKFKRVVTGDSLCNSYAYYTYWPLSHKGERCGHFKQILSPVVKVVFKVLSAFPSEVISICSFLSGEEITRLVSSLVFWLGCFGGYTCRGINVFEVRIVALIPPWPRLLDGLFA